jgi:hypothetical protein
MDTFPINNNYFNFFTMIQPYCDNSILKYLSIVSKKNHNIYHKKKNSLKICQWIMHCMMRQINLNDDYKHNKSSMLLYIYYHYEWQYYKTYLSFLIKKCKLQNVITIPQTLLDNPTRTKITNFIFNCKNITIEHIEYTGL